MTPLEIDTQLGKIFDRIAQAQQALASSKVGLAHAAGFRAVYVRKRRVIQETTEQALAALAAIIAADEARYPVSTLEYEGQTAGSYIGRSAREAIALDAENRAMQADSQWEREIA